MKKILFLSRWFPYPADNGSKLRISNLLRALALHHHVTLLSFADQISVSAEAAESLSYCSDIYTVPWREFDPHRWRARSGLLSLKPRSLVDTFSSEMAKKITQLLHNSEYDLVVASQLSMAAYRPYFRDLPALFEEVEIGLSYGDAHYSMSARKRLRHTFTWFKLRIFLSRLLASFQSCTMASEEERNLLVRNFPRLNNMVEVIPNGVQISDYGNQSTILVPNQLIFSGSLRYQANYEAMIWFVREVFHKILEQVPTAQLMITGDHADLSLPSERNITRTGYVDDIKTLIASSWVSVAPLLSGGGTRLKILESMAIGTPVVSTSKGSEGLRANVGKHLFVTNEPQSFADYVVKILKNKELRESLSIDGKQFVKDNYNWDLIIPRFLRLIEKTAA
jgi:glycosyltransferase involved in cell wall biosynthesis